MPEKPPIQAMLSLRLKREEKFFGPGVAHLLALTNETGSLHKAASEMGMAYSKALRIVKTAQEALGFPLLTSKSGGAKGGGSALTAEGAAFLAHYQEFAQKAEEAVQAVFEEYYGNDT